MRKVLFSVVLMSFWLVASENYYYADTQKIPLFSHSYSQTYHAELYATSPSPHARKMFAPDRIIVCLSGKSIDAATLADRYGLKAVRRMPVSRKQEKQGPGDRKNREKQTGASKQGPGDR